MTTVQPPRRQIVYGTQTSDVIDPGGVLDNWRRKRLELHLREPESIWHSSRLWLSTATSGLRDDDALWNLGWDHSCEIHFTEHANNATLGNKRLSLGLDRAKCVYALPVVPRVMNPSRVRKQAIL
jgi:hypothetical protein